MPAVMWRTAVTVDICGCVVTGSPTTFRLLLLLLISWPRLSHSACSEGVDAAITARARGTDCFKSPEMLLVGGSSHHKEQRFYDRRRRQGAGPASDIWSLGCLLYELVTGEEGGRVLACLGLSWQVAQRR